MRQVEWFYDFVSPFSYLQTFRFGDLPGDAEVVFRPVLLAGLLDHWGTVGPAEVGPKRLYTYRHVYWLARRMGVPYRLPPAHPFNSLKALRLAIALGGGRDVVFRIFRSIWEHGLLPDRPEGWQAIGEALGVEDGDRLVSRPEVGAELRANGALAIAKGVFGVPTFVFGDVPVWGLDGTDLLIDVLNDPGLLADPEWQRIASLPVGARRPQAKTS